MRQSFMFIVEQYEGMHVYIHFDSIWKIEDRLI